MYLKVMQPRGTFQVIENVSRPVIPVKNGFLEFNPDSEFVQPFLGRLQDLPDHKKSGLIGTFFAEQSISQYGFDDEGANHVYYDTLITPQDTLEPFNYHGVSYWDSDGAFRVLTSKHNIYLCNDNGQTMESANVSQPKARRPIND